MYVIMFVCVHAIVCVHVYICVCVCVHASLAGKSAEQLYQFSSCQRQYARLLVLTC